MDGLVVGTLPYHMLAYNLLIPNISDSLKRTCGYNVYLCLDIRVHALVSRLVLCVY